MVGGSRNGRTGVCAILLSAWAVGCAGTRAPASTSSPGIDPEGAIEAWEARRPEEGAGATVPATAAGRSLSSDVGEPGDGRSPGPRARIDVDLASADVHDALRILADAAGLALVVSDDVSGTVDLTLRDVDPIEAMRIVAETHGALVEVRGGVVHVTPR